MPCLNGLCAATDMTDCYSSDDDEDCGQTDSLTLPPPWIPAAVAQRHFHRQSEEGSRGFGLTLPPPWAPAAAAAPRRSASPPWSSGDGLRQDNEALLTAAVAAAAAAGEPATIGDQVPARSASTGTLAALVSPQHSPSTGGVSCSSHGAAHKPGGWLSTFAMQHNPELKRRSGKFGSAPDFGEVQTRIRAHRPSAAAGAYPDCCAIMPDDAVAGQGSFLPMQLSVPGH